MRVVAAVIGDGARVMLARRGPTGSHPGCWEFPGGKVEVGETPQEALAREVCEELGLTVRVGRLIATASNRAIALAAYSAEILEGVPELREHDDLGWFYPHELPTLTMTELNTKVSLSI